MESSDPAGISIESASLPPSPWKRLGVNLLVAAISLTLTFLILEAGFRLAGIGRPSAPVLAYDPRGLAADPNPEVVFMLRPGFEGAMWGAPARFNRFAMRDDDIASDKAPDEFRILALGDSMTYGVGVRLEQTFAKVLERCLNEGKSQKNEGARATEQPGPRRRFHVYNAGVPAYDTGQEYHFLTRLIEPVKPDLVVLNFTLSNDYETPYRLLPNGALEPTAIRQESYSVRVPLERSVGRISYVYRFFAERIRRRILAPRTRDLIQTIFQTYREDEEGWRRCKDSLRSMKTLLDGRGAGFAVFLYPEPTEKPVRRREDYEYLEIRQIVERFCRENGIVVLDVLDDILTYPSKRDLFVTPTDAHPSPLAHEIVARALLRELRRYQLVPLSQ